MRVFAAIELPSDIRENISALSQEFNLNGITLVGNEVLHITLHFFGEIEEQEAHRIEMAMRTTRTGNFEVGLRGISAFTPQRPRTIFVNVAQGNTEITGLHARLNDALGIEDRTDYIPHVTIARVRNAFNMQEISRRISEYSDYDFGSFAATSMVLKRSTLTGSGPIHKTICEVKL